MKLSIGNTVKSLILTAKKKSPTIMAGLAVGGVALTAYLAYRARPSADDILLERREKLEELKGIKQEEGTEESEYKKEVVEVNIKAGLKLVKTFAPTVISGVVTSGLIIGSNQINLRRIADISALYEISSDSLKRYKEATNEVVGDKKEEKIREAVLGKRIEDNPINDDDIIQTGKGNLVYFDLMSGRYFTSCKNSIDAAVNELNAKLNREMYVTLNEFYYLLGLPGIKLGENLGFDVNNGIVEVGYTGPIERNGSHCIGLDYDITMRWSPWRD